MDATDVIREVMEAAVGAAARGLRDLELRADASWENACHVMAQVAVEVAAPILAGQLLASYARLSERAEWAENEVIRLRAERERLRRLWTPKLNLSTESDLTPLGSLGFCRTPDTRLSNGHLGSEPTSPVLSDPVAGSHYPGEGKERQP
jgi:hypothetical protein